MVETLILGDSLNAGTLDGSPTPAERLVLEGYAITNQSSPGMSLMQLQWTLPSGYDNIVMALLTNDAYFSMSMVNWQAVLEVYVHRLRLLHQNNYNIITILPTLSEHSPSFNDRLHMFRWYAATVAIENGQPFLDMNGLVTVGSDGLHYESQGAQEYADVLETIL